MPTTFSRFAALAVALTFSVSGCHATADNEIGSNASTTQTSSGSSSSATTMTDDEAKLKDPCRMSATRVGDSIVAECSHRLLVNGVDHGMTQWHFEIKSGQGGTTHLTAEGNFTDENGQSTVLRLVMDDDKYRIEAGDDGSIDVQWAGDANNPDLLVVNQLTPQGWKKSNSATCHGLTDFQNQMQKLNVSLDDVDINACDGVTTPDPRTGCFPCPAIQPYLTGLQAYTSPGLRGRMHFAQDEALKILKDSGDPNAGIIGLIIGVIAAIVTTIFATSLRCGPGESDGTYTTECGGSF